MLIKAGYLNPDETKAGEETWKVYEDSTGTLGMDAACEVFYNMVLNYHPETLSPQYDEFHRAANAGPSKVPATAKGDRYAHMRIHTLSSTLVGLEKQALSYRRDIVDDDYPTEWYRKIMLPEEDWLYSQDHLWEQEDKKLANKDITTHVKMERTYLNAWDTFYKRT